MRLTYPLSFVLLRSLTDISASLPAPSFATPAFTFAANAASFSAFVLANADGAAKRESSNETARNTDRFFLNMFFSSTVVNFIRDLDSQSPFRELRRLVAVAICSQQSGLPDRRIEARRSKRHF